MSGAAHSNQKGTIRGLLGFRGVCWPACPPALSHCHGSKQSGALSHLITMKPEAPFFAAAALPVWFPSPACWSLSILEVC